MAQRLGTAAPKTDQKEVEGGLRDHTVCDQLYLQNGRSQLIILNGFH